MIKKKISMLGAYGVGKTSLVRRFVHSIFSEKYLSTIGVKIDKKTVRVEGSEVDLLLWDIAGEDDTFTVPASYIQGSAGYLLVIDGTRRMTLERGLDLQQRTQKTVGEVPFVVVLNKLDLVDQWEVGEDDRNALRERNWVVLPTSAKDGTGVEEAFLIITRRMMGLPEPHS